LILRFPSCKKYGVNNSFLRRITAEHFPSLRVLKLRYICVQALPRHLKVTMLRLISCKFDASYSFPFPNLNFLLMEYCVNKISPSNPLPKLARLRELILKQTVVTQTFSRKLFPRLKRLEMRGDVVQKFYLPNLVTLSLDLPSNYNLEGMPKLRTLVICKDGDNSFLEMITQKKFPNLLKLVIDLGIRWNDHDLSLLPPHKSIEHLRVACMGTVNLRGFTEENYPNLTTVDIDSDFVDLSQLPPHHMIANLIIPKCTSTSAITRNKWPNIATVTSRGLLVKKNGR